MYDLDANLRPETLVRNDRPFDTGDDGAAEIDAEQALKQVVAVIDDVLKRAAEVEGEIICVATSAFWHSLMGIDGGGKPTTRVMGWADTRSRKHVATLRKKFDEAEVYARTGARFHPSYWPAKLLWLRNERPAVFESTNKWISFSDFVGIKLFENSDPSTSVSMASATGIFDIRKCEWDRPLLKSLGISRRKLPRITASDLTFLLNARYRRRWPRLSKTRFVAAIGDGAANNIGAGCVTKTKAALMVGTSGAMRVAYRGAAPEKIPNGLWCYRIDRERVIIGGALSDGGGLYQWLKDTLRLDENDDMIEAEIAKRPPDSHGLTFLPFLAGERSTGYHEFTTGGILGLKSSTDPIDIVHAALESVAYRFAEIFDQLKTVANIREIAASGGALDASPVWTQIIADVLGRELLLIDEPEASLRGAVLLALESIGNISDIESGSLLGATRFVPENRRRNAYIAGRKRHEEFYRFILDRNQ